MGYNSPVITSTFGVTFQGRCNPASVLCQRALKQEIKVSIWEEGDRIQQGRFWFWQLQPGWDHTSEEEMGVSLLLREETTWKGRTLSSTFSVNKKNKKKWFMFYSGHRRTAWKELKRFLEALRLLTRIAQFFHHPLSSFLLNFGWLICSEHLFPAQTWYHIEQLEKHQRSQPGGIAAKLDLRTTKQMQNRTVWGVKKKQEKRLRFQIGKAGREQRGRAETKIKCDPWTGGMSTAVHASWPLSQSREIFTQLFWWASLF